MYEYENMKRIQYESGATFIPVCETCRQFVKPDKVIRVSEGEGLHKDPNAYCKKCGRTHMVFEGFI